MKPPESAAGVGRQLVAGCAGLYRIASPHLGLISVINQSVYLVLKSS